MAFIRITKTTPEHGLREYYIDVDQISMVNTGQMETDQSVVWLKGSQVFIESDLTVSEVMGMLLSANNNPEVFDIADLRRKIT